MTFENFRSSGPFRITAAKARKIFRERIVPELGAKGRGTKEPTYVMVAGTQGSGKTTSIRQAELALDGPTQIIIPDEFLGYVPGYHELAGISPSKASKHAIDAGCLTFAEELANRARSMGHHIVHENSNPNNIGKTAAEHKAKGYRTELHFVTAQYHQSLTGIHDRIDTALRDNGHPGTSLVVGRDWHDQVYAGWPRAIFDAEQKKQFDRIVVKGRDGTVLYENELVPQKDGTRDWANPPLALEAVLLDRHKAIDQAEANKVTTTWDRIAQSPHMARYEELRRIPLTSYRQQIVNDIRSKASRVDLSEIREEKCSREDIKLWQKKILTNLQKTLKSRKMLGNSPQFEARINKYLMATTAIANHYLIANRSQGIVANANFSRQPGIRHPVNSSNLTLKRTLDQTDLAYAQEHQAKRVRNSAPMPVNKAERLSVGLDDRNRNREMTR